MSEFLDATIKAAREAGRIQLNYFGKKKQIISKGGIDIVTNADIECENQVVSFLKEKFPEHGFVLEEGKDIKESDNDKDKYVWYIDPIDGTTNYAHNVPHFCVSIALEKNTELVVGVVFDPIKNELFYAEKGKGAFLNEKEINVSGVLELDKSIVATGFPYERKDNTINNSREFCRVMPNVAGIRRFGSAALDLCYVATGRFDGYWELTLKPWDYLAGKLIIEEAGGKVTDLFGKKLKYQEKRVLASNGRIHNKLVALLSE